MFPKKTDSNIRGIKRVAGPVFAMAVCSMLAIAGAHATDACGPLPGTYRLTVSNSDCKRNIEMTPLCKIEVTHPRVLGSREVCRDGVVDEQAGVQPS